jgi:MurNAc alpha-1-phosphate uridylyltransferase
MMKTAMILAAGRGERLKPLTDFKPKALCTVHNIPLIEYHVAKLAAAGFKRLVINHAYLGGQIRQHLGDGRRWGLKICYSPEPPGGLETGGGIVNALPLLGDQPFVTVNADIYTDYNFALLKLPITSLAHLVLVNKPSYSAQGDFGLSESLQLDNTDRQYTFAGIACYRPELFDDYEPGRYSVTPLLRQLAINKQATGELHRGEWFDIGSPQRLKLANKDPAQTIPSTDEL